MGLNPGMSEQAVILRVSYFSLHTRAGIRGWSGASHLVQDLPVARQQLGQVSDQLLDALQAALLHDGARLLSDGLWDGVSGQVLQGGRQVQRGQDPDGRQHVSCQSSTSCLMRLSM